MTDVMYECASAGNDDITAEQKTELAFIMDGLKTSLAHCLKVDKVHFALLVHTPTACVVHSNPHIFANLPGIALPFLLACATRNVATRSDQIEKISTPPTSGRAS